jgi:hypothetical protein
MVPACSTATALTFSATPSAHAVAATSCSPPTPRRASTPPDYQQVFATEARTPNQAIAKIRPLAEGRRLQVYLATGTYKDELADARCVA